MPIVFVTGHVDVPTSVKAMKGGAIDLPTKPIDRDELLAAIARAVAKDAADLNEEIRIAEIRQRVKMLTVRETQVVALVVTGMLNKQIAYDLGVGLRSERPPAVDFYQMIARVLFAFGATLPDGVPGPL
jgi:FixJ family two-component response regulator